jgi:hypothetical protein
MIQGNARIVRIAVIAAAVAMVTTLCIAQEPAERLRFRHPEMALHLSVTPAAPTIINSSGGTNLRLDAPRPRSFYEGYLIPGLEKQLSRVGVLHTWILDRPDLGHHENLDDLAAISEKMFEKGASRALRSYLSEISGLETMVLNLAGRNEGSAGDGEASRFNLGLGISSAMPRVDIGYRIGAAANLRLSLCADGVIDVNYGHYGRLSSTRFYAGYDTREGTADAGLRISF